jgi:hypothetical protein
MEIRKPAYAGSFYSADQSVLSSQIDRFIANASLKNAVTAVTAIVAPHAGYIYSGPVAAYSYAAIKDRSYDVVIILAPSHRAHFDSFCTMPSGSYETPFGLIPIDENIAKRIHDSKLGGYSRGIDQMEHSLEVQLPFLQKTIGMFSLVPVIIGTTEFNICREIAQSIFETIKDEKRSILIVISTDLSHYHTYEQAKHLDGRFKDMLEKFDEKLLFDLLSHDDAEACGEGPLLTGMVLAKLCGAKKSIVLNYANSGDTAGDKKQVVGYISAVFTE